MKNVNSNQGRKVAAMGLPRAPLAMPVQTLERRAQKGLSLSLRLASRATAK